MFNRRALSALGRHGLGRFTEGKIQLNCRWTILGGGTDLEHGLAERFSHERNDDVKRSFFRRNEIEAVECVRCRVYQWELGSK